MNIRLLSLEPRAVNSAAVESLPSYLVRLAAWNGISPHQLISFVLRPLVDGEHSANGIRSRAQTVMVRPNEHNRRLFEGLLVRTWLQQHELNRMTFANLAKPLARSPNSYTDDWRWCPYCYRESLDAGVEPHHQLIWTLEAVTHCPGHRVPLRSQCSCCQSKQNSWRRRHDVFTCITCGENLARTDCNEEPLPSWRHDFADLVNLVDCISRGGGGEFAQDGPQRILSEIFDEAWASEEEMRIYKLIPRDELLCYIDGSTPITLNTARRIAAQLDISLTGLLRGESTSTRPLNAEWSLISPDCLKRAKRSVWSKRKIARTRSALRSALEDPAAPALKTVAGQNGASTGGLWHHHPKLCAEVIERHRECVQDQLRAEEHAADLEIAEAIRRWRYAKEGKPTRKGLFKALYPRAGLGKRLLVRRIAAAVPRGRSSSAARVSELDNV